WRLWGVRQEDDRGERVPLETLARADGSRPARADYDRRRGQTASVLSGRPDPPLPLDALGQVPTLAPPARGRGANSARGVRGPGRRRRLVTGPAERRRPCRERWGALPDRRSRAADRTPDHRSQLAARNDRGP